MISYIEDTMHARYLFWLRSKLTAALMRSRPRISRMALQTMPSAWTLDEKFAVIRDLFKFAISHRVRDKKGIGESNPRKSPRKTKHHYNRKKTH